MILDMRGRGMAVGLFLSGVIGLAGLGSPAAQPQNGCPAGPPDATAVLEANRTATAGPGWRGAGTLKLSYAYAGQGLTGVVASTYDVATGDFVDSFDIGPTKGADGFDGRQPWAEDISGAVTPQGGGDTRQLAVNEAYRDANLWWRRDRGGAVISILPSRAENGTCYDVLQVTPPGGKPFQAWFDTQTHLLARTVEPQGSQTVTTRFSDYRPVEGLQIAGKQVSDQGLGERYAETETLSSAQLLPARPASAYAAPKVTLTDGRILNPAGRTTVPFKLLNNHIYAEVRVNGKGPFLFIFDTGGHDLLTPGTAKALAVPAQGQLPGTGAGEGVVDVGVARNVTFQIGDLVLSNQTISVLPFENAAVEGFTEQGMIGFEVFRRFVTRIDYGSKTITFIDPARFDPKDAGTPIPFLFYNHEPEVTGRFEGIPGRFDIDTGSRVELTLTKPFAEAHDLKAKHPKGVTAVDGWGVGGPSISYVTRASELTLGPVRINDIVAGFATQAKGAFADPNYDGNVGSALLKRFVMTFDYGDRIMYLKPLPGPVPDAGTYDRAGMWINTSPQGFAVVAITAGGPAEAAGLKIGDQITAVDGVTAGSIAISDLRRRLRDEAPGTVIRLSIERGGPPIQVTLTLKDQI